MKIHSIQYKFLSTVLSAILAITVCIGGLAIYEVDNFVQQQTESFIKVTCEKERAQVNDIFGDMEKSVNIMSGYILDFLDSAAEIESSDTQNLIIEYADRMFADVASHTVGAVAYYLRFAPEISDGKTGFFYSKVPGLDQYFHFETTDLFLYDKEDIEHVGWYWQPYNAGKPVWMEPYYNKNNDIMMVSYVVPLYREDQFVGVVGMDFDYTVLSDQVENIKIYENGFAHLELNGVPVHNDRPLPSSDAPEEYLQVSADLVNGMTLVLSASYRDIQQIRNEIAIRILYTVLVLAAVFCIITLLMVRQIVKPLNRLTQASKKLADGDYNVDPVHSDTYEIQLLSTAFENMAVHLREHEKMQYLLAHIDPLTGLRNTTSYRMWLTDFNKKLQSQNMDFGVIMMDVNYLKETNDKYGHDVGNKLLITAAQRISGIFKRSPVFRMGGDEFLIILQNRDLDDYKELCKKFDLECASEYIEHNTEKIPVSIARGFARYDPSSDMQFMDVFNRADDAMYVHKKNMKAWQALQTHSHENDSVYM